MARDLFDVFLSYARRDLDLDELAVERLAAAVRTEFIRLAGREARVFIDKSIRYGEEWPSTLQGALDSSRVLVACLSPTYFHSQWCHREWRSFATTGKPILPIRLRPWDRILEPPEGTDLWMKEVDQIQMPTADELLSGQTAGLQRFVESLVQAIGGRSDAVGAIVSVPGVIRLGINRAEFETRLAQASAATIVGVTHEHLKGMLERTFQLRSAQGWGIPLWRPLRIVFLDDTLLKLVVDERSGRMSLSAAEQHRVRTADSARREIARFLELNLPSADWSIHEYPYMLPFVGAFFDLPDHRKIAHVATLSPGRAESEALCIEFDSTVHPGETAQFESAFGRIVTGSPISDEMVIIGRPQGEEFVVSGGRLRRDTWKGNPQQEFVAAILALLWQRASDGTCEPLLQIRTVENSRREVDYLSNISGFIGMHDLGGEEAQSAPLVLSREAEEHAVNRELGEELNQPERCWHNPVRVGTARYHFAHPMRESFIFVVYTAEFKVPIDDLPLSPRICLGRWSFDELLELRRQQTLRLLCQTISTKSLTRHQLKKALEFARLNLLLHGEEQLASQVTELIADVSTAGAAVDNVESRLREAEGFRRFEYSIGREDRSILGLAGLQYREFFRTLVPAYATLGVPHAQECLIRTAEMALTLGRMYVDRELVRTVPFGLDGVDRGAS